MQKRLAKFRGGVSCLHADRWIRSHPTDGQTVDAQRAALSAVGLGKGFQKTASGAKTDRRGAPGAARGDTLLVTRLDRLARSTRGLLNTLDWSARAGAGFILADAWADPTTPHGRLMLPVLGGLAEFERDLVKARTGEGRAPREGPRPSYARARRLTRHQRQEALEGLESGTATHGDLARRFIVKH